MGVLDKTFALTENGTNFRREMLGGFTTFATMSYIIFVNPVILSAAGMDKMGVMFATCVGAAVATLLMAFLANYPIALAPAMGHNAFFAFTVCGIMKIPWQQALGAIFVSGLLFIFLSAVKFREKLVEAIPDSLKHAIAVGIGILIALIGLEYGGIIRDAPATLVTVGDFKSEPVLLAFGGLAITAFLLAVGVRGAVLIGILATACIGMLTQVVAAPTGIVALPEHPGSVFGRLSFSGFLPSSGNFVNFLMIVLVFLYLDLFDTVGTLVGVAEQAGFMKEGKLPRAGRALLSDAIGTSAGAVLGTTTITSYIESATGVQAGARTGLANIFTALLFIVALFFAPLIKVVGGACVVGPAENPVYLYPVIAPALIVVGCMMMKNVVHINWNDTTEALPAFLALLMIPLSFSITDGIALGFIFYAFLKLVSGRGRECHWIVYVCAVAFIFRYFLRYVILPIS